MRSVVAVLGLALVASCFTPHFEECSLLCGVGCPAGWSCGEDGFCHAASGGDECETGTTPTPDATPDANEGPSDAGTPDVPEPDAAGPAPDAGCARVSLLTNGDFDDSTGMTATKTVPGWTATGAEAGEIVRHSSETLTAPHSGEYAAWVARLDGDHHVLCQEVDVPAGATALEVTFVANVSTDEDTSSTRFDKLRVEMRTAGNVPRETFVELSNLDHTDTWVGKQGTATMDYAGETTRLCLDASNDVVDPTTFRIDDLTLEAVVCP